MSIPKNTMRNTTSTSGKMNRQEGSPLYRQVADVLRLQIQQGQFNPREPMPTHRELVTKFDVSPATIREALRTLTKEGLIVGEQGRGTFVRQAAASDASESEQASFQRVGLVMPLGVGSFFAGMVEVIEDAVESRGSRVVLINNREDADLEMLRVRDLVGEGVDGLLWMCPEKKSNARFFRQIVMQMPVVAIDRTLDADDELVSLVEADNYGGMYQMVQHMVSQGRRHIALVKKPVNVSSVVRRGRGYEMALRDAGIEPRAEWIFESRSRDDQRCVERILESDCSFDAIVCETDDVGLGVIYALHERGVRVPDDIAVSGFNDSVYASPLMTSVGWDVEQMGSRAANLLMDQIEKQRSGQGYERARISIPTHVVPRASTVGKTEKNASQRGNEATVPVGLTFQSRS